MGTVVPFYTGGTSNSASIFSVIVTSFTLDPLLQVYSHGCVTSCYNETLVTAELYLTVLYTKGRPTTIKIDLL